MFWQIPWRLSTLHWLLLAHSSMSVSQYRPVVHGSQSQRNAPRRSVQLPQLHETPDKICHTQRLYIADTGVWTITKYQDTKYDVWNFSSKCSKRCSRLAFLLVRFDYNIHVHRGHGHLIYMFSELKLTFTLIDFILTVGTIESRKALTSETAVTTFTSSTVTVNGPAVVVKIVLTLTAIKSCMEMK